MKILKSIYKLFFIFFFILFTNISVANVNQLSEYYKTIRCLVCEGQSIQESDTEFAINLKEQIQKKYESGMDLKQINQELISIYGEEISFNPSNDHFILWGLPLLLLVILIYLVRNKYKK
jgi:cytochrome c-type biogenesis protein CcmH|tara:strand:+ start:137 stop:496 length:360 start_codon:yes stop_codon:yes gene_type:complete